LATLGYIFISYNSLKTITLVQAAHIKGCFSNKTQFNFESDRSYDIKYKKEYSILVLGANNRSPLQGFICSKHLSILL
jgi:hypothetical protein